MPAVIDASIVVKLFVKEDDSPLARMLINRLERSDDRPVCPVWCRSEVANALIQRIYKGDLATTDVADYVREIPRFVQLIDLPEDVVPRALEIAVQLQLRSIYDVQYLALAESLGCDYWTADERFSRLAGSRFPSARWLGGLGA
jgi:predicted nucleic acid-binding protein